MYSALCVCLAGAVVGIILSIFFSPDPETHYVDDYEWRNEHEQP